MIISEGSIKELLKNFVHFENAILLIAEELLLTSNVRSEKNIHL